MRLRQSWLLVGLLSPVVAATAGCGEEDKGPEPPDPFVDVPKETQPTLDDGHWGLAQRGVAIDAEDIGIIQESESPAGVSVAALESQFGHLVLNLPLVDYLKGAATGECVPPDRAGPARPLASAQAFRQRLEADRGLSFDTVAVNVDLLSPRRTRLLHECFEIAAEPRFGEPQHRAGIIAAFEELATLDGLAYVTVGLDMNRYYHLRTDDGRDSRDDYANFVTLYREVYDALKAARPELKVGPGLSWEFLVTVTAPEIAETLGEGLADDSIEAFYRAWQRTVQPLLEVRAEGPARATADFVAFSMMPDPTAPPFNDEPAPSDPASIATIEKYYARLNLAAQTSAGPIPVVLPVVDWRNDSAGAAIKKTSFLTTLKRAVSHVDIAWVAWRRLSSLPTRTEGQTPPCDRYTTPDDDFHYRRDYCNAGLVGASGEVQEVFQVLTTDP